MGTTLRLKVIDQKQLRFMNIDALGKVLFIDGSDTIRRRLRYPNAVHHVRYPGIGPNARPKPGLAREIAQIAWRERAERDFDAVVAVLTNDPIMKAVSGQFDDEKLRAGEFLNPVEPEDEPRQ